MPIGLLMEEFGKYANYRNAARGKQSHLALSVSVARIRHLFCGDYSLNVVSSEESSLFFFLFYLINQSISQLKLILASALVNSKMV